MREETSAKVTALPPNCVLLFCVFASWPAGVSGEVQMSDVHVFERLHHAIGEGRRWLRQVTVFAWLLAPCATMIWSICELQCTATALGRLV